MKRNIATRDPYIIDALASGKYSVDGCGRVFNNDYFGSGKTREICPYRHPTGYLYITLKLPGKPDIGALHHRVVAIAILGPPPAPQMDANHIDGNKQNNHPSNLEWTARSENVSHAYRIGIHAPCRGRAGEHSNLAKLNESTVRRAHQLLANGISRAEIAQQLGTKYQTIVSVLNGGSWRNIYREFHP